MSSYSSRLRALSHRPFKLSHSILLQHRRNGMETRRFSSINKPVEYIDNNNFISCKGRRNMNEGYSTIFSNSTMGRSYENVKSSFSNKLDLYRQLSSSSVSVQSNDSDTDFSSPIYRDDVRNVAIVAHVDHGKTTLVDELLRLADEKMNNAGKGDLGETEDDTGKLVMDSGELEMERGITITSKVTRLTYGANSVDSNYTINVVDTPGHADFAGEVDRILGMVSGVCLLIDAAEGCMPQTKYVLSRALSLGLTPICVLNKLDRPGAMQRVQSGEVESELLDLFDDLGATDEQMEYVTVYASGKGGWATLDVDVAAKLASSEQSKDETTTMHVLFQTILDQIPPPQIHKKQQQDNSLDSFSMAATNVGYDTYLGRTCTGRIYSGNLCINDNVRVLPRQDKDSNNIKNIEAESNISEYVSTVSGIFVNKGVSRMPLESGIASAGDIVTIAGVPDSMKVGDTLTSASNPVNECIETPPLAPPTLSMDFGANSSPLMGKEGDIITSSRIRSRLIKETDNNVTLQVTTVDTDAEKTRVYGRGELQIGILIEQMRREGFELTISPPQVVTRVCPDTKKVLEPFEEVIVDVDDEYAGTIVNALTNNIRGGVLMDHQTSSTTGGGMQNKTRLIFEIPSRGLLGFSSEIATLSRGSAVLNHTFIEDRPKASLQESSLKGKLISSDSGKASLYALASIAERGTLFIETNDLVYAGMVIGENSRGSDLEVNPVRAKAVNNMRSQNKEEKLYIPPPVKRTVEEYIGYMNSDEVMEVTPLGVRLRKKELDAGVRARMARSKKKENRK